VAQFGDLQTNHTPAFVRDFCTQKFMACTTVLDAIIMGGLQLDAPAAEAMEKRGHAVRGTQLVASVSERLKAIEMYGKFGPGIRMDHHAEDGPPRRSVIEVPPWDYAEAEDVTNQRALPDGTEADDV